MTVEGKVSSCQLPWWNLDVDSICTHCRSQHVIIFQLTSVPANRSCVKRLSVHPPRRSQAGVVRSNQVTTFLHEHNGNTNSWKSVIVKTWHQVNKEVGRHFNNPFESSGHRSIFIRAWLYRHAWLGPFSPIVLVMMALLLICWRPDDHCYHKQRQCT